MLIKNQLGTRIMRTDSVQLVSFPPGKHGIMAADRFDPEGIVVAVYDSEAKAKAEFQHIWAEVARGRELIDLSK